MGAVKYNTVSMHDQENGGKGLFFCGLDREHKDHVEDIKNSYLQTGYFFGEGWHCLNPHFRVKF